MAKKIKKVVEKKHVTFSHSTLDDGKTNIIAYVKTSSAKERTAAIRKLEKVGIQKASIEEIQSFAFEDGWSVILIWRTGTWSTTKSFWIEHHSEGIKETSVNGIIERVVQIGPDPKEGQNDNP